MNLNLTNQKPFSYKNKEACSRMEVHKRKDGGLYVKLIRLHEDTIPNPSIMHPVFHRVFFGRSYTIVHFAISYKTAVHLAQIILDVYSCQV